MGNRKTKTLISLGLSVTGNLLAQREALGVLRRILGVAARGIPCQPRCFVKHGEIDADARQEPAQPQQQDNRLGLERGHIVS
jgi:hypothetical protein